MTIKFSKLILLILIVYPLIVGMQKRPLEGKGPSMNLLFEERSLYVRETNLTCDPFGRAVAVWYANQGGNFNSETDTIYLSIRDSGGQWSSPIDVIYKSARFPAVLVDPQGYIHLFFRSNNCIMHMKSLVTNPRSVKDWDKPICIIGTNGPVSFFDIKPDYKTNEIHLVYSLYDGSVFYTQSDLSAENWINPKLIPDTSPVSTMADSSHVAVDGKGRIHVVWSLQPQQSSEGLGVFYTRSEDNGITWSQAVNLAGSLNLEPNLATVGNDIVHVVWNGNVDISKRYHRWSQDGGNTWSDTEQISNKPGGILGAPGIAATASGKVIVLMAEDVGALYQSWQDGSWQGEMMLTQGNQAAYPSACFIGGKYGIGIFEEGNQKIWVLDMDSGDLPEPAQQIPTIKPQSTITAASVEKPTTPTPTVISQNFSKDPFDPMTENPGLAILVGAALAVVITAIFAARKLLRTRK